MRTVYRSRVATRSRPPDNAGIVQSTSSAQDIRSGLGPNLLLVEDNPVDRVVLQAKLSHAFPKANLTVVGEASDLTRSLRAANCDVVVTDYWLGWSDGLSVLQRSRQRWPGCRVIMVTGNGGEEVVSEALKFGLHDYLLKPHGIERLVPAVRSAIESKRAEDRHQLWLSILSSITDAIYSTDLAGLVTCWNRSAERLYGYTADEMIGRSVDVLTPVGVMTELRRLESIALNGEPLRQVRTMQLRKDGRQIAVVFELSPVRNQAGFVVGLSRVVHHGTAAPAGRVY